MCLCFMWYWRRILHLCLLGWVENGLREGKELKIFYFFFILLLFACLNLLMSLFAFDVVMIIQAFAYSEKEWNSKLEPFFPFL